MNMKKFFFYKLFLLHIFFFLLANWIHLTSPVKISIYIHYTYMYIKKKTPEKNFLRYFRMFFFPMDLQKTKKNEVMIRKVSKICIIHFVDSTLACYLLLFHRLWYGDGKNKNKNVIAQPTLNKDCPGRPVLDGEAIKNPAPGRSHPGNPPRRPRTPTTIS